MLQFTKTLALFFVLLTSRLAWAFPLPQDNENGNETPANEEEVGEEEEQEEEGEEEYYEEELNKGTTITPGVYSTGDEEVDNYLKRNYHVKQIVSEKLGITNFTRQSLYEQSANALFSYIADRTKDQLPTEPPTLPPIVVLRTRKYKVRQGASTSTNPFTFINQAEVDGNKKTFEITVPEDITNNAGDGPIEISIPKHLTSDTEFSLVNPDDHLALISKSTHGDNAEGFQSIEAAIQEALLMAQKKTGINISSVIIEDKNSKKTFEINDLKELSESSTVEIPLKKENESNSTNKSIEKSKPTLNSEPTQNSEPEIEPKDTPDVIIVNLQTTPEYVEYVEYIEEIIERTRKPIRVRTTIPTTTKPSLNPIKALLSKQQSQNPGVSGFIFDSVINTTKSGARIAASAVWCALFDHCPGDKDEEK